jgi:hypothetical protein
VNIHSLAILGLALGAGCGGGGPSITFNGTVQGQSFFPKDAISASVVTTSGSSRTAGVVVIANAGGQCDDLVANRKPKKLLYMTIVLEDLDYATGATAAPTSPGTYGVTGAVKKAYISFTATDGQCAVGQIVYSQDGTVALISVSNGAYTGTFDVHFDSGDHVTGSFSATACSQITPYYDPSTATWICG